MKRILLIVLVPLAAYLGGRWAYRALASDSTKIRWKLDEMCEGFNETRLAPILTGLAPEWFDEALGADRELAKLGLTHLFFEQGVGPDRAFPYRVVWSSAGEPLVRDDADARVADYEFELEFFKLEAPSERSVWKAQVSAALRRHEGDWRFVRTRTITTEGRMLR